MNSTRCPAHDVPGCSLCSVGAATCNSFNECRTAGYHAADCPQRQKAWDEHRLTHVPPSPADHVIHGHCQDEAWNHNPHYWGDGNRFYCHGDRGRPVEARTCCDTRTGTDHLAACDYGTKPDNPIGAAVKPCGKVAEHDQHPWQDTASGPMAVYWCSGDPADRERFENEMHERALDWRSKKDETVADMVEHPAHYGGADNPYEVIKVCEAWGLDRDAYLFNVVKYIGRPTKGNYLEDLKKARFFLDRRIAQMERDA